MKLSDISIQHPVFAWMLMFALMIFGWISFGRMGISSMPDVDFPVLTISVSWQNAAPEIMESQVVDVIEDAVTSVQGVRDISSTARNGSASISVEFDLSRDIDVALQEIQSKLAQAMSRLPKDIDAPIVTKSNPEDQPIMWVALYGDVPLTDIMLYAQNTLKGHFQSVPGVGEVFLGGYQERSLRVWLDADKLAAHDLTVADVLGAIQKQHSEVPGGRIETPAQEFNVRTMGEFADSNSFGNLLITQRGGQTIYTPIRLKEVARIEDGLADFRRLSRVNGQRSLGLGIRKQRGANAVEVNRLVKARMADLEKTLPAGMRLRVSFDSTRFIKDAVHELNFNLILSVLLTSAVCFLFLGSWTSTLNILLAIPTSVLGTFIVLYFMGFTLNTITLLGLTLAIGIIVDDAIMVLENIVRHREKGENKLKAAIFGAREITFAALAATVAIMAIFLPVVFMKGIIGKFFYQFGVTITAAVGFSLLEALTIAPMRCSQFLQVGSGRGWSGIIDRGFRALAQSYRRSLELCLSRRWTLLVLSLLFFVVSVLSVKGLKKEFVPAQDQSMFMVRLQTPVGSSIEFTDERFRQAEAWLQTQPAVEGYFSAVGGFGGGEVNTGVLFVTLKPKKDRPRGESGKPVAQAEFMDLSRKEINRIPDLKGRVLDMSQQAFSAGRGFPIEFSVRGADFNTLISASQRLVQRMEKSGLVVDVDSDYKAGMPEVQVVPDRQQAYAYDVPVESIGRVIQAMVGGIKAGDFTDRGRRFEIRVRAEKNFRLRPQDLGRFYVRNNHGELVQLSKVTRIEEQDTLLSITRKSRERAIGIYANVAKNKSQANVIKAVELMAQQTLPDGYRAVFSGSAKTFKESFQSLGFALALGVLVSYMVLGAQFNSFLHPLAVLLALPFSFSGAFLALLLAGKSLNVYSFIGLILLMGIVKKNSILLVDFTNQRRREGLAVREALLDACPTRLRPILMTSVATIAAAVPPALSLGPGSETRVPMALAVIGGVLVSTLLTLFVVPCAYSLMSWFQRQQITDTEFSQALA